MDKNFSFRSFKDIRSKHLKKHPSSARDAALVPLGNGWGFDLAQTRNCACSAKQRDNFGVGVNLVHVAILAIATSIVNSHSYIYFY